MVKVYIKNTEEGNKHKGIFVEFELPVDDYVDILKTIKVSEEAIENGDEGAYSIEDVEFGGKDIAFEWESYSLDYLNTIVDHLDGTGVTEIYDELIVYGEIEEAVYDLDFLDEFLDNETPSTIADMIHYGSYNPYDDFFMLDGYGNIVTMSAYEFDEHIEDTVEENISTYIDRNI